MSEIVSLFTNFIEKFSIYTKEGLENLTSAMIVLFSLLFIHIYIYNINDLGSYLGVLFYPLLLLILYLMKILVFSYDYLLFGDEDNRYVRAFQYKLPSKYIAEHYGLKKDEATHLWLNIFNLWQKKGHNRNIQVNRTFKRGYACRFVFYSIYLSKFYFTLSLGVYIMLNLYSSYISDKFTLYPGGSFMLAYIILIFALKVVLIKLNKTDIENLTGVWKKFEVINDNHIEWIRDNIKKVEDLKQYALNKTDK